MRTPKAQTPKTNKDYISFFEKKIENRSPSGTTDCPHCSPSRASISSALVKQRIQLFERLITHEEAVEVQIQNVELKKLLLEKEQQIQLLQEQIFNSPAPTRSFQLPLIVIESKEDKEITTDVLNDEQVVDEILENIEEEIKVREKKIEYLELKAKTIRYKHERTANQLFQLTSPLTPLKEKREMSNNISNLEKANEDFKNLLQITENQIVLEVNQTNHLQQLLSDNNNNKYNNLLRSPLSTNYEMRSPHVDVHPLMHTPTSMKLLLNPKSPLVPNAFLQSIIDDTCDDDEDYIDNCDDEINSDEEKESESEYENDEEVEEEEEEDGFEEDEEIDEEEEEEEGEEEGDCEESKEEDNFEFFKRARSTITRPSIGNVDEIEWETDVNISDDGEEGEHIENSLFSSLLPLISNEFDQSNSPKEKEISNMIVRRNEMILSRSSFGESELLKKSKIQIEEYRKQMQEALQLLQESESQISMLRSKVTEKKGKILSLQNKISDRKMAQKQKKIKRKTKKLKKHIKNIRVQTEKINFEIANLRNQIRTSISTLSRESTSPEDVFNQLRESLGPCDDLLDDPFIFSSFSPLPFLLKSSEDNDQKRLALSSELTELNLNQSLIDISKPPVNPNQNLKLNQNQTIIFIPDAKIQSQKNEIDIQNMSEKEEVKLRKKQLATAVTSTRSPLQDISVNIANTPPKSNLNSF